jgi:hypothetical protein
MLRVTRVVALVSLALLLAAESSRAADPPRPNVIIFLADDKASHDASQRRFAREIRCFQPNPGETEIGCDCGRLLPIQWN